MQFEEQKRPGVNTLKYSAPPKPTKVAGSKTQAEASMAHPTRLKNAASKGRLLFTASSLRFRCVLSIFLGSSPLTSWGVGIVAQ